MPQEAHSSNLWMAFAAIRVWAAGTAPPNSIAQLKLTTAPASPQVVRGQHCGPGFWGVLTNPWVSAGLITAAIAIPIAVSNDDSGS